MIKNYYILILIFLTSCAQFVPPTGGKKDENGPRLISSNPKTNTKNFKGKTIELEFDELIDVSTLKQELIITPQPKGVFTVKPKSKNVKIAFDNNFEDSTTYTLNFRNGIRDMTEKNPSKNLKLVFSTGQIIDSLKLEGEIIDIQTKLPQNEITVGLYKNDTLPFSKKKPDYFIKTDSSGKYYFENLKADKYRIIAFSDKNQNLLFDQKNESIGFIKDSVDLKSNIQVQDLEVYRANFLKNKIKKSTSRESEFLIQTDKPIIKAEIPLNENTDITYTHTENNINIFKLSESQMDTLKTTLILTDSLLRKDTINQKIYFTKPFKANKYKVQSLRVSSTVKDGSNQTSNLNYQIKFESPITQFDSTGIIFKTDTSQTERLNFNWKNKFELELKIKTKAKEKTELIFKPNTFKNYKGDTNTIISIKNNILQSNDLAKLQGKTEDVTGTKIAQLLNIENGEILSQKLFTDKFTFVDIIPGSYQVKIIFDDNANGIWDPGSISENKMPEKILITKEPVKIKANFEIKDMLIK